MVNLVESMLFFILIVNFLFIYYLFIYLFNCLEKVTNEMLNVYKRDFFFLFNLKRVNINDFTHLCIMLLFNVEPLAQCIFVHELL